MFTYERLEEKTVAELRNICRELNITGMSKKRKGIIIDAILDGTEAEATEATVATVETAVNTSAKITGITGTFQTNVTNPSKGKGERLTTVVRVSAGASFGDFDVAGKTVGAVAEFLKEVLNISSVSKGMVDGEEVPENHILKGGEGLEFIHPAGTKG